MPSSCKSFGVISVHMDQLHSVDGIKLVRLTSAAHAALRAQSWHHESGKISRASGQASNKALTLMQEVTRGERLSIYMRALDFLKRGVPMADHPTTHPQFIIGSKVEPELMHAEGLHMHFRLDGKLHGLILGCGHHVEGLPPLLINCVLHHHVRRPFTEPDVLVDGTVSLASVPLRRLSCGEEVVDRNSASRLT
jgi:hypothetical protein